MRVFRGQSSEEFREISEKTLAGGGAKGSGGIAKGSGGDARGSGDGSTEATNFVNLARGVGGAASNEATDKGSAR